MRFKASKIQMASNKPVSAYEHWLSKNGSLLTILEDDIIDRLQIQFFIS
jgi:hypothetical protein